MAVSASAGYKPKRNPLLRWGTLISVNALVFAVFVLLLELALYLLYAFPPRVEPLLSAARKYHTAYERRTLHFMKECFQHNPSLSYVLRSSGCNYKSREFNTRITPNSARFRDTEESLVRPEIVVLGDSHAFGWGVSADETFAKILEGMTARKTLNAGIPSYGTYRETELLKQIDTSNVKLIVVQYADNDIKENFPYVSRGYRLDIMRKQDYAMLGNQEILRVRDDPSFQYLRRFWPLIFRYFNDPPKEAGEKKLFQRNRREARYFLDIIGRAKGLPDGIPLIVLEINSYNKNDSLFLDAIRQRLKSWRHSERIPVHLLDLSPLLTEDDYFVHDDHMRPQGQRRVAEALAHKMNEVLKLP